MADAVRSHRISDRTTSNNLILLLRQLRTQVAWFAHAAPARPQRPNRNTTIRSRSVEIRDDLPDFRRRMLTGKRRSGNQIFAHRQPADDNGVETNLSDEVTSSASARSDGGTSRPSALAVLRLMTRSNLLDCITGISAGFWPFRMRPVWEPAWRNARSRHS
jgi:hypothetical protein